MAKILNVKEIRQLLPYRYPMLMLDRVALESDIRATAVKNITMNELFFQGHFPVQPVMPGVLQVETMKQLAEILVVDRLTPVKSQNIYMRKVDKVKFRNPVTPGDRILVEADLVSVETSEAVVKCRTSNKSGVTCEATITLAIRQKIMPNTMPELFTEYDKSPETLMDTLKIQSLIPHRYPFLLVDNVVKIEDDNKLTAIKNLSINEEIFQGCPDDYVVLPESIPCEIMAQAGCAFVLSRPENKGKLGYFMTIDHAESYAPVYPGDQLVCELILPSGKSSRFGKGQGVMKVDGKVVFEINLMFAIVDPEK